MLALSTQRTQAPHSVDNAHNRADALDPLENKIGRDVIFMLVSVKLRKWRNVLVPVDETYGRKPSISAVGGSQLIEF